MSACGGCGGEDGGQDEENAVGWKQANRLRGGAVKSLAAEVGLSVRGVEKNLAQLKSAGKIRRIGGRKGGRWMGVKGVVK